MTKENAIKLFHKVPVPCLFVFFLHTSALTQISQMETRPQHRRLVAGTRPATTLSPVAYISTDFIGCARKRSLFCFYE